MYNMYTPLSELFACLRLPVADRCVHAQRQAAPCLQTKSIILTHPLDSTTAPDKAVAESFFSTVKTEGNRPVLVCGL